MGKIEEKKRELKAHSQLNATSERADKIAFLLQKKTGDPKPRQRGLANRFVLPEFVNPRIPNSHNPQISNSCHPEIPRPGNLEIQKSRKSSFQNLKIGKPPNPETQKF